MEVSRVHFRPIDFSKNENLAIRFREDSFIVSFGEASAFHESDGHGAERHIDWLKAKHSRDPNSALHVWADSEIIGQVELGKLRDDPTCGYVNLYYLVAEARGKGLGTKLDRHAVGYFQSLGLKEAKLCVSPTNTRALAFYSRMGWGDLGPRVDIPLGKPSVNFMGKCF